MSCVAALGVALVTPAGAGTLFRFRAAVPVAVSKSVAAPALPRGREARFRTVDVPGAFGTNINGVTDAGALVGTYYTHRGHDAFGFIKRAKHLTKFNYPGTKGVTYPGSINDHGTAVGLYTDATGTDHGWTRSATGHFHKLDYPSAASGKGVGTRPSGINDAGVIVGEYIDKKGVDHGFIHSPKSGFRTVDAPGAGTRSGQGTILNAINDAGVIVGHYFDAHGVGHGFVYSQGRFFDFDGPGAGTRPRRGTVPTGITRAGVIDGFIVYGGKGFNSGWLLSGWQFSRLNDPVAPPGRSAPLGINQNGAKACGTYFTAAGKIAHGFVATLRR